MKPQIPKLHHPMPSVKKRLLSLKKTNVFFPLADSQTIKDSIHDKNTLYAYACRSKNTNLSWRFFDPGALYLPNSPLDPEPLFLIITVSTPAGFFPAL